MPNDVREALVRSRNLRDVEIWEEPAPQKLMKTGIAYVKRTFFPSMNINQLEEISFVLSLDPYITTGEFCYALTEVLKDTDVDKKRIFSGEGNCISAADFAKHISNIREIKNIRDSPSLTRFEVQKAVTKFPALLSWKDFRVSGFKPGDGSQEPTYQFVKARRLDKTPAPMIRDYAHGSSVSDERTGQLVGKEYFANWQSDNNFGVRDK